MHFQNIVETEPRGVILFVSFPKREFTRKSINSRQIRFLFLVMLNRIPQIIFQSPDDFEFCTLAGTKSPYFSFLD